MQCGRARESRVMAAKRKCAAGRAVAWNRLRPASRQGPSVPTHRWYAASEHRGYYRAECHCLDGTVMEPITVSERVSEQGLSGMGLAAH